MELRVIKNAWQDLAASESRIGLMEELEKLNVGFSDIEEFNLGLISKFRSEAMKERGEEMTRTVLKSAMKIKMRDEQRYHEEMVKERNRLRRGIGFALTPNSNPYRRLMRELRGEAAKVKEEYKTKYDQKLTHLKQKYKDEEEGRANKVPEMLQEFENLSVFSKERFEEINVGVDEILCVSSDIEISEDERAVLRLHTKFSVIQVLQDNDLEFEQEQAYAKIRMERRKDLEEIQERNEEDEEEPPLLEIPGEEEKEREEEKKEEDEARTRQTFDPIGKIYDDRKRRVTDLQECNRVTLPKPLPVSEEALIEMRREIHSRIFKDHREEFTNNGEQRSNLTDIEIRGLRSLLRRMRLGELIIMKTDKSGKFCIVSVEDYLKMGEVHVKKDQIIGREEMIEIEKTLNGHAMSWCKIWGTGAAHKHEERVMSSKTTRSENRASLYLMYKDHKKEPGKTRPVVTGCTSNTRGLSNSVSNFLEAVANCNTSNFESISDEDMLSKTKLNNKDIENIVERWEKRRESKIGKRCRKCNLEEIIKACLTCKREEKTCVDIRVCQLDVEIIEESGVEKEKNENEEPVPEKYLGELVPQSACQLDGEIVEESGVEKEKNQNEGPVPENTWVIWCLPSECLLDG